MADADIGRVNVNTNGNTVDLPISNKVILSGDNISSINLENTHTEAVTVFWSLVSE